ncbi:MAG: benzoyl-CoA reductase subunit A [Archangiaceae bacterium]|nr:benzoyl-CoA reductase subunit A [Archangiaceae bacterium]
MTPQYFLGIDLGSTTSKAVLIDAAGKVVGQGLTNTRSNYDVAAQVAKAEALSDARLSRLEQALVDGGFAGAAQLATALRRTARILASIDRLEVLEARCAALARAAPDGGEQAADAVHRLFTRITGEAEAVFGPLATDRSRFFRDVVGARFLAEAEAAAGRREVPYEVVVGAWDRAIIEVENAETGDGFDGFLDRALSGLGAGSGARQAIDRARRELEQRPIEVGCVVGTGYGRARLPFPKEQIRSEILCHGLGAHAYFPQTRTVLDIGGQDTKAIQIDEHGVVTNFQMNDRCAAGCGRYLGYIAEEMNLGIHELGPLALEATRPVKISSTCTVFAGVELRERLSLGEKRENILLGLHRAIVLRAMSLLARSGGVAEQLTFTGGVAKNAAVVQELKGLVTKHYGERTLNTHPGSIFTGALGAALFAERRSRGEAAPVLEKPRAAKARPGNVERVP